MEISKSLQEEIRAVQNKLKNAIQNHQVYVGKLNGDPNNEEILGQLHEIQEHIISLSKCQKQVVQRLRKEVKLYEAANSNGIKVSIGSLLGLNNNNHITNNNETTKSNDSAELRTVNGNNLNGLSSRRSSKDDYEDEIQNVDPSSPSQDCENNCPKGRTRFDELDSNEEEEDVIEINTDINTVGEIKTAAATAATVATDDDGTCEIELCEQLDFLGSLGLITSDKHDELQNKRAERKRRSTANPQFVYSNWEIPTKRKRHSYLQSNGTAPQTRQTTARLNGPSPPPSKAGNLKPPSPPSRTAIKSLIPTQKSSTRPNILRNNSESKLFSGKIKSDNGLTKSQQQPICAVNKSVQSVGNKAVHIPGLPSSLTIERIESDSSAVCIHCRNPGSLTVCEICEANFHVSCHAAGGSASQKFCPKCYIKTKERDRDRDAGSSSGAMITEFKREDEIATTSDATGVIGKAGKDTEIDKTVGGFYQTDAEERVSIPSAIGINQLPSSTFLIPIATNTIPSCSASSSSAVDVIQSESVCAKPISSTSGESNVGTSCSSILINQLSQSSRAQSDCQAVSYAYQLPVAGVQSEKSSQSYLIVKKISESLSSSAAAAAAIIGAATASGRSKQLSECSNIVGCKPERRRRSTSSIFDYQQFSSTGYNDHDQSEIKSLSSITSQSYSIKPGELPGKLKRNNGEEIDGEEDEKTKLSSKSDSNKGGGGGGTGGEGDRRRTGKFLQKFNVGQIRSASRHSNSFVSLHSIINSPDAIDQFDTAKESEGGIKSRQSGTNLPHAKSKTNLLYSLFSGNNEPNSFPGCVVKSENSTATATATIAVEETEPELDIEPREIDGDSKRAESEPRFDSPSCSSVTEYVKLEEAHLPAPFRPNLGLKSVEEIRAILGKKMGASSSSTSSSSSSSSSPSSSSREERNESLETEIRNEVIKSKDFISFKDYHDKNLRETLDFIATERKHSNTYIKFHNFEESDDLSEKRLSTINRKDNKLLNEDSKTTSVNQLSRKSYPVLRKKLLPNDIKAEFEKQDLPINDSGLINRNEKLAGNNGRRNSVPEEGGKSKLGINVVSTENMLVLEQFESAMLKTDEDETANC